MTNDTPAGVTPSPAAPTRLWIERTGTRRYTGRSSRGAEVLIGSAGTDGVFSPGELVKIALAGCTGLTSDAPLARRLGEDYAATITVAGDKDLAHDKYPAYTQELVVDLSALDAAQRERLLTVVHRSIDEHCTVGRTLKSGASVQLTVTGER